MSWPRDRRHAIRPGFVPLLPVLVVLTSFFWMVEGGAQDAFESLASRAEAARRSGDLDEAIDLYRQAVAQRDGWGEGWWRLGTLLYDGGDYPEAHEAFQELLAINPKAGPAWLFLGLSEYRLEEYQLALESLSYATTLGVGSSSDLIFLAHYHRALCLNRFERFEEAYGELEDLLHRFPGNPQLVEAFGINVLRLPRLPTELDDGQRRAVDLAGRAGVQNWSGNREAAGRLFDRLVDEYPDFPNVHYGRGVYLLNDRPDEAMAEFLRELERSPGHLPALLQVAFEWLRRGEADQAEPFVVRALAVAPDSPSARMAMGTVHLQKGRIDAAVTELEAAVRSAPKNADIHSALGQAYARAGRREDALKQRQIVAELRKEADAATAKANPDPNR